MIVTKRQRERLLHPLEVVPGTENEKYPEADPARTVKCYTRSAAGVDLTVPENLRPFPVLLETIRYLLSSVLHDPRFSYLVRYNFISDRIRSVSQDMVIQEIDAADCIRLYEPVVKFHAYSAYALCQEKISEFDPFLNGKQLMEYTKRLLVFYDSLDVSDRFGNLSVGEAPFISDRSTIEALYILYNLTDESADRYFKIPHRHKNDALNTAFHISLHHIRRDYVRIVKLIPSLPTLPMCIAVLHLPEIRRLALQVMSVAYHAKNSTYPISNLKTTLLYQSDSEVSEDCTRNGIKVINDNIVFTKEDSSKITAAPTTKIKSVDEKLRRLNLTRILLNADSE